LRSPEKTSAITITVSKADADLMRLGGKSMLIPDPHDPPLYGRRIVPKLPVGHATLSGGSAA
jgi:hypothetical protein